MFMLMLTAEIVCVYIASFKDDFTKEKLEKVAPILIVACLILIILSIVFSIIGQ